MKRNSLFRKVLTIALAGLIAVSSLACTKTEVKAASSATAGSSAVANYTVTKDYDAAREVLAILNAYRASNKLPALKLDYNLTNTAMLRAAETIYISDPKDDYRLEKHIRPNDTSWYTAYPSTVFSTRKQNASMAENIAAGQYTPHAVMSDWENSPDHNKNLLKANMKYVGIGCVIYNGTYRYYWAQDFSNVAIPYVPEYRTGQVTETVSANTSEILPHDWADINGTWYHYDSELNMETSCYRDGYWLNADGSWNKSYSGGTWKHNSVGWWYEDNGWYPKNQWLEINGNWYYFNANGYMDYSEYRNGYWLNADGSWNPSYSHGTWNYNAYGWWYEDNGWYPTNQYLWIDGVQYYFNSYGYWQ